MWFWLDELKRLGFRRSSEHLWLCEAPRYGLRDEDHLAIFDWSPPSTARIEVHAFHVTFLRRGHNLHFYYRELEEGHWYPEGYSERQLIAQADRIARAWTGALGVHLSERSGL